MRRIITSLVAVLTVVSVQGQTAASKEIPKLVIGITVDQLRGDYLDLFQYAFSERGFKRLLNGGLVYENISFNFPNLDDASAIATIYSGTTPFYHGITGNRKYLPKKQQEVSSFDDNNYLGNYTQQKVSPLALQTSTITDELKTASHGVSFIYSFAPNSAQALASAGRGANCAFWVEDFSGQWASSTYYKDFYWLVDQENRSNNSYAVKVWGQYWTPLLPINNYRAFPYTPNMNSFQYSFGTDNRSTYQLFKQSPIVNESVVDIATKLISKAELGKSLAPDFVALTLYAGNYPNVAEYSVEMQDVYVRLDKDIEKLLNAVDQSVGLNNVLIFLTSTGYYNYNQTDAQTITASDGTFYVNRCEALLNMYLMAIYGKEQWVDRFYNGQVYFNRKLIEDKGLSLKEIQQKSAEFIADFTGVQDVYTSYQLLHGEWNPIMEYYKNGFTKETSGDLFIELHPGFKVAYEQNTAPVKIVRESAVMCPVIFFGNGIKPEKVKRTIKATEIAPSVTHVLRIRPPNATKDKPLSELL